MKNKLIFFNIHSLPLRGSRRGLLPFGLSRGLLLIALCCLTSTSCEDNDKEPSAEEQEQQMEEDMDQAAKFWDVIGQLTDDIMPDEGWQTATYAPSIGEPDGSNDAIRIVPCADTESAAQHFASLIGLTVGDGFPATTTDYTYTDDLIGTLHYQRVLGSSLATVDVDIKQMPGLSQIIYKDPEQMQDNGTFNGTAYYSFGDVVSKQNADGQTDYWICVRPCFGPAGKGDSHWISVSKLPSANMKQVPKMVNGAELTHIMPKGLATNQNQMQNLAELLYAMLYPKKWSANLQSNYSKLKYFVDLKYTKYYKYHNKDYFESAAELWGDRFKTIFGLSADEMRQELGKNGLNLIYNSASMSGNNVILPMAQYTGANLKTRVLVKKKTEWKTSSFNIYDLTKNGYAEFKNFAGGVERAWLVRYATGATLAKGSRENPVFNKFRRLPNCSDVIVFNRDVRGLNMDENNLKVVTPTEFSNDLPPYEGFERHYIYGDIYKDEEGCRWFVCSQSGQTEELKIEEKSPYAELITFDGIKFSPDGTHATNLPTLDQAIRGAFWLNLLHFQTFISKYRTREEWENEEKDPFNKVYLPILDNTGVQTSTLFQTIIAQNGSPRSQTTAASIAYYDETTDKQCLMRFVLNQQNERNDREFYAWTHYPKNPSLTAQKVTDFSDRPIYLQDISDPELVKKYAPDSYAIQPLDSYDFPEKNDEKKPRQPRSETDERAQLASNYLYNAEAFWNRTYPADMWNEPILMFRITRVKDCGPRNYSLITVDGHTLTHVASVEWGEDNSGNEMYWLFKGAYGSMYTNFDLVFLNGKKVEMPKWEDAW